MICNFCGDPAAHPSTGCQYGPSTLACARCTRECWDWVRRHTNGKSRRLNKRSHLESMPTFYECAAKYMRR